MSDRLHVLHVASWFPSEVHPSLGNFVERHIDAINTRHDAEVWAPIPVRGSAGQLHKMRAHNGEENYAPRSPSRTVKGKARLANRKAWDARAITPIRRIKEFRDFSLDVKPGDSIGADVFEAGDYVDVIGKTKGRGFQGVVKRWNFGGGRGSHGSGGWRRRPGSIGAGSTPGHVIKGKQMPGHMGQASRTVQNLEIIQVQSDDNLLLVKGAIPGTNGDYVVIRESKKKPKKTK